MPNCIRKLPCTITYLLSATAIWLPIIIIPLIIAWPVTLYAQSGDTTYIESYSDKFIIKANLNTQDDSYFYTDKTNGQQLKVSPNIESRMFLSLDYEFIGVSIGFSPDFINRENEEVLKGNTSFSDYQFRIFLGNWVQTL